MSLLALTICLTLSPQAPDSQDGQVLETRFVPIREWVTPSTKPLMPRLGSFLGKPYGNRSIQLIGDQESTTSSDEMIDLVRQLTGDALDEFEVSIEVVGATMRVSGPPDQLRLVEDTVHQLTTTMVHSLQLRAELFRVPEARLFPASAAKADLDRIRSGLQRIWSGSASCESGRTVSLNKDLITAYVYDVDVEIAQDAKIGDPVTAELFEGVRLLIEPHALTSSSDLVLYAQFAFGELREPTGNRPTGVKDLPSLDVPHLDCNSGTISGRISDGGALLLSVQGDPAGGGNMLLMITAQHQGQANSDGDTFSAFPVSALLSQSMRTNVANSPPDEEEPGGELLNLKPTTEGEGALGPRDPGGLLDLIHATVNTEDEMLMMSRKHLLVSGSKATRQAVRDIVQRLQERWLKTARVDVQTTMKEMYYGHSAFPKAGATTNNDAPRTLHHITFPALLGRPHSMIRGHETTVIRESEVEIAQKSSLSDPIIGKIFSGVVLSFYAYPQQRGLGVESDLDLFDVATPRRRASETKDGGDLFLPSMGRARFNHRGPASSGADLVLGEGPTVRIGDRNFRTRQVLRVTLP